MKPLFKEQLTAMHCTTPGCDHSGHDSTMFIHSRCHPRTPTWLMFEASTGTLEVSCSQCKRVIAVIAVASESAQESP